MTAGSDESLPLRALVSKWNDTAADFPRDRCVHHLFEEQVARTPDSRAVVFQDLALTYRELNRRANRLAHDLRDLGVGPDTLVGLCVERSIEMVVGLLGILKAGGAYVPLNPSYPRARLAQILDDAEVKVMVTQRALRGALPGHGGRDIYLDDPPSPNSKDENPGVAMEPQSLGYVIYTSGSTGRPKGICLPHLALVNLIVWHNRTLLRGARTLQYAALTFDASFHEMFAAWCSGGVVFVIAESARPDIVALAQYIYTHQIEKVILPVIVLQRLSEYCGEKPLLLGSLRELTTTGEQLHITRPIIQLLKQIPDCSFHNHYGPSESHVVTAYTLPADADSWPAFPPLGRPIANTQIYLLDEKGELAEIGAIGELYIGGVCLARCYLGRPDLTAERFIADRFSSEPGSRLYRTGDLGRYRPDGNIEFLGRIDHQVKIRGFRVELDEIEATLGQHPAVKQVAVLAREETPGDKRLVAYIVPSFAPAPGAEGGELRLDGERARSLATMLRAQVRNKLPDFMVPAAFVMLAAMPLTQNGKLDRRALPAPGRARPPLDQVYVAPRSQPEHVLASMWRELLGIESVGVEDGFFDLGGDSIHAAQLLARLYSVFGVEVSFKDFFARPTIVALDALLAGSRAATAGGAAIPVAPRDAALPLSFQQERLWFLYELAPASRAYNCPSCFRLRGPLDAAALSRSLQELLNRHEILRTRFSSASGSPVQQVDPQATIALTIFDLTALVGDAQRELARQHLETEAKRLFKLEEGPLFRAALIRLHPDLHLFLLNFHHIVIDGWSLEIALRELAVLYESYSRNTPVSVLPPPIQYADYAAWQRQQAQGPELRALLHWWRERLQDVPPLLELPADRLRPKVQSYGGGIVPFRLDPVLTAAARKLAGQHGMTLSMTLLAAFSALIHRYTNRDDIVIGIPSANRHRVELEDVLGFFVNTLPMRIDASGDPTCTELLARVRVTSVEAFAHDELPFDQLVQELRHERNPGYNPVVQIGFAPQPPAERDLWLADVRAEPVAVDACKTILDLTLYLWEEPTSVTAHFEYSTDLFEPSTVQQMASHFLLLLAAMTAAPQQRVSALSILSEAERSTILSKWSGPTTELPQDLCLHQLFEAQAARTPLAVAAVLDDQQLTYRELDERASQLARRLQHQGLAVEQPVGCCLERSLELVIAFLGILKAGGMYLPLDPKLPAERLLFMLADSAAPILLTQTDMVARLAGCSARIIRIDEPEAAPAPLSEPPAMSAVAPHHAAYVIYTSGSTGRPKGVVVEHRSAVNFVYAQHEQTRLDATSRVLQFTSPGFDVSIWEFLMALTAGATLVMTPVRAALPGPELHLYLRRQRVSAAILLPSVLAQLPAEPLPELTTLVSGAESCSAELVERWAPGRRFVYGYGPTEATIATTLEECFADGRNPLIGRPLANLRVYVLDPARQLVPAGVAGELFIGGAGVARGYLNQRELSAQRFVPDPFAAQPDARMYKSGDLVRWRADGNLEFLGRIDQQIKLRGFRIELGEIEAVLREHPAVTDAVVVVREDPQTERRLVAYVVLDPARAATAQQSATWRDDWVGSWRGLYDDIYRRAEAAGDPTFNTTGWNSSYTGQPIAAADMREWRDQAVARIAALQPRRVWEIGCGSGILLFRLAPACAAYLGTDFSQPALAQLREQLAGRGLPHVALEQREAAQCDGLPAGGFDLVILNSVVQYFPELAYLRKVLEGAVAATAPGGVIWVGDVRSLPLLGTFHTSIQLYQATPETASATVRDRVARAIAGDKELVIAPDFFRTLVQQTPELSHVEVWLKRGQGGDEMTRYRYDVMLYVGGEVEAVALGESREFGTLGSELAGIERWLVQVQPPVAEVLAIPNARVFADWQARQLLQREEASCGELAARAGEQGAAALEPESLWQLGERLGYGVRITYSATAGAAYMDVLFERDSTRARPRAWRPIAKDGAPAQLGHANSPLNAKQAISLIPELRSFLRERLPGYMVPAAFVALDALPLGNTGKVDRRQLPPPVDSRPELGHEFAAPESELQRALAAIWRGLLGVERIGLDDRFFELGGHSLLLARVRAAILGQLGREVAMVKLLELPTLRQLAAYLEAAAAPTTSGEGATGSAPPTPALPGRGAAVAAVAAPAASAIAIIGMAGRFPKARDVETLWANLCAGLDGVTRFTAAELAELGVPDELVQSARFVPVCGFLQDAMSFDAAFFGCSPKEALYMDPQHRSFLMCAWSALEDAGYAPASYPGAIGVFGGAEAPRYWLERIGLTGGPWTAEDYQALHGNLPDNLTTRVAYKLGLRGPAMTVLTACSTSLVAVHLACQSLLLHQCDMALAGGAALHSAYALGHLYQDGSLLSRSGYCRPFDQRADGLVSGSGVAAVVLKRLEDAIRDGDCIRAVIRGSATNNDGAAKASYTAPSVDGQVQVLGLAQAAAGVAPETISFVESHGTGTQLGDTVEFAALNRAFAAKTARRQFCALGAIKSSIGHLGAAAGVTGLIKATLALQRQLIPATLHFQEPPADLNLPQSPFFVNTQPLPWPRGAEPRRAGVSGFGAGGTNAHVVLEEAPLPPPSGPSRSVQLLPISARTDSALETAIAQLGAHLAASPEQAVADIAFTLQRGRTPHAHRCAVVARDSASAAARLALRDGSYVFGGTLAKSTPRPKLVFMFPGGGTQRPQMGVEFYQTEPVFRAAVDRCAELFQGELGCDLRGILFPAQGEVPELAEALLRPAINNAAIFTIGYALGQLLLSWQLRPAAVTGHSLGEYVAACHAGILSLEDAVALIGARGRIFAKLADGVLMIALLSEAALATRLTDGLEIAAVNGPESCVVAGDAAAAQRLLAALVSEGYEARLLPFGGTSHCALVEPHLHEMTAAAAGMSLGAPKIPIVSNVTGRWMTDKEAQDPAYWARHLRSTVRFHEGLSTLLADPDAVFLEVGPGRTLSSLCRRHPSGGPGRIAVNSMTGEGSGRTELEVLMGGLAQLWCHGVELDWQALSAGEVRRRVPLPTYPFECGLYDLSSRVRPQAEATRLREQPQIVPFAPLPQAPGRSAQQELTESADPVTRTLAALWAAVLGVAPKPTDNFFDQGASSFFAVQLCSQVRDRLDVPLSFHALLERPTFGALLEHVRALRKDTPPPPAAPATSGVHDPSPSQALGQLLVTFQAGAPGQLPLFLIQPAGGTVFCYAQLAHKLDPRTPIYGIRASGMESGEEVLSDLPGLVSRYIQELRSVRPEGPYVLGGHSAGGVMAFAVAQQLLAQGQEVRAVIMLDSPSGTEMKRTAGLSIETFLEQLQSERHSASQGYNDLLQTLQDSDSPFRAIAIAIAQAIAGYEPLPLSTKLVYVFAKDEPPQCDRERAQYWMGMADRSFALHRVAGDHFAIMEAPCVDVVAEILLPFFASESQQIQRKII